MVLTARGLARVDVTAVGDTLAVGLCADEVGDGLGVFRGIGGLAVAADAAVLERFLARLSESVFLKDKGPGLPGCRCWTPGPQWLLGAADRAAGRPTSANHTSCLEKDGQTRQMKGNHTGNQPLVDRGTLFGSMVRVSWAVTRLTAEVRARRRVRASMVVMFTVYCREKEDLKGETQAFCSPVGWPRG